MNILYTKPSDEQVKEASSLGKVWRPIYNGGVINHYKLLPSKQKGCNCR